MHIFYINLLEIYDNDRNNFFTSSFLKCATALLGKHGANEGQEGSPETHRAVHVNEAEVGKAPRGLIWEGENQLIDSVCFWS